MAEASIDGASPAESKLVHLAARPAGASQAEFLSGWSRYAHSRESDPALVGYQSWALVTPEEEGLPAALAGPGGLSLEPAGVGLAYARSPTAMLEFAGSGREGEDLETFGGPPGEDLHPTTEDVIFDHGGTGLTIFSFLHRRRDITRAEFSKRWRAFAREFLARETLTRHCSRHVQDHVLEGAETRFDGIAEMGFREPADALAFLSESALAHELFPLEEPFIDRTHGIVVLTRRVPMRELGEAPS
jgi:hypothetical protein